MQVKIYQPAKTSTQSGKKHQQWIITPIENENHRSIDNVMGWTSSDNTLTQLELKFQSADDAVKYAKTKGWSYQIIQPQIAKVIKKSYAENFS
ncbi:MAG: NADH dehydrogenase ubiquinone Fe-S protein 4 [Pseudomonadota bacterium]